MFCFVVFVGSFIFVFLCSYLKSFGIVLFIVLIFLYGLFIFVVICFKVSSFILFRIFGVLFRNLEDSGCEGRRGKVG